MHACNTMIGQEVYWRLLPASQALPAGVRPEALGSLAVVEWRLSGACSGVQATRCPPRRRPRPLLKQLRLSSSTGAWM